MSNFGFDVGNTKAQAAFDPLPPGWYSVRITRAEMVPGKKQETGEMCKLGFEIDAQKHPAFVGRQLFANLCHQHQNKQTRDIARAQIAAIAQSIGRPNVTSTDDLLGGELLVKVTVRPAENGYDAGNEIRGYRAPEGASAPAAVAPAAAKATPAKPWAR